MFGGINQFNHINPTNHSSDNKEHCYFLLPPEKSGQVDANESNQTCLPVGREKSRTA
jgi:hypothetical protein